MQCFRECVLYVVRRKRLTTWRLFFLIVMCSLLSVFASFILVRKLSAGTWQGKLSREQQFLKNKFNEELVLKLDELLERMNDKIWNEARTLKESEDRIALLMSQSYIHKDQAPASPAEYIFPLHPAEVVLQLQMQQGLKTCSDIGYGTSYTELLDSSVPHQFAEVKKIITQHEVLLQMSLSQSHSFFKHCSAFQKYWSAVGTDCVQHMHQELIKEAILRQELDHYMIVQLLGYCTSPPSAVPTGAVGNMSLVTEYGTPLDTDRIIGSSFATRLSLAADLAHLLIFLETSKYGSIFLAKVSHTNFIEVDKQIKLFDLSGVDTTEPYCIAHEDCVFDGRRIVNCSKSGICTGFNAKANIVNFNRLFFQSLLAHTNDIPLDFVVAVSRVKEGIRRLTLTSSELYKRLQDILSLSQPVMHSKHSSANVLYKTYANADLRGRYDYRCHHTRATWGCALVVRTLRTAEQLCTADHQCKAFVSIPHRSRKDWYTVFQKNGVGYPDRQLGATLHVKLHAYQDHGTPAVGTLRDGEKLYTAN